MRHPSAGRPLEPEDSQHPIDGIRQDGTKKHIPIVNPAPPQGYVHDKGGDAHMPQDHSRNVCCGDQSSPTTSDSSMPMLTRRSAFLFSARGTYAIVARSNLSINDRARTARPRSRSFLIFHRPVTWFTTRVESIRISMSVTP